jgi:hypothetical protein
MARKAPPAAGLDRRGTTHAHDFPENAVPGIGSIVDAVVLFGIMTISLVAGLVITRGSLACIFRVMTYAAARQHASIADPPPAFISTLVRDIAA